ncbi:MAG: hypothetical protein RL701_3932 [Pseudomonadota bacterium]
MASQIACRSVATQLLAPLFWLLVSACDDELGASVTCSGRSYTREV